MIGDECVSQMLYWSMLAYKHGQDGDHNGVTLQGAMRLYGLQHSELVGGPPSPTPHTHTYTRCRAVMQSYQDRLLWGCYGCSLDGLDCLWKYRQ